VNGNAPHGDPGSRFRILDSGEASAVALVEKVSFSRSPIKSSFNPYHSSWDLRGGPIGAYYHFGKYKFYLLNLEIIVSPSFDT
jgi:hypothetical protein